MEIGEKIKCARLEKNLTQEELGNMLGVQKSAIAKWENGRVINIKRSNLKKLSDILEIPAHELISTDFENPTPEMAEFHAKIIMDEKLTKSIEEYYQLDKKTQSIVRNFIHSLATERN